MERQEESERNEKIGCEGSAEMCAGVPLALQTPNPTGGLQECPEDVEEHQGAQSFVSSAVFGVQEGPPGVCVPILSSLWGRDIEEKTTTLSWCLLVGLCKCVCEKKCVNPLIILFLNYFLS